MKLWSDSFKDGGYIPGRFAFCVTDPNTRVALSTNRNPHLAWDGVPAGTKSLVVTCVDIDVPSKGDDVNQAGKTIPDSLPRVEFFHWALIDLPAATASIAEGAFSDGVIARGKPGPEVAGTPALRHGINDYTGWFAQDADMAGDYHGYDGPCPPWNDSVIHRYVFTVRALDIARVPVGGQFTGKQVCDAIKGHVLAEAQIVGMYTLNLTLVKPSYGKTDPA